MQHHVDLDLTFDLAVLTLTYEFLYRLYIDVGSLYLVETLARGCMCASWCDL